MKHRSPHRRAPRSGPLVRSLAACSLLTLWPGAAELHAQVLPSGMNTIAGQASARTVGGTLTVNNSPNAIINWNSFSIGAGNAVRFEQASPSSQVLNRVIGNDPSSILGSLSSNGRVWLLNPNGVLFGQGARVDVAGLVTSTLNLNNADWLAGNYRFVQGAGNPAGVVNQGELRSTLGGHVMLIGATVRNEGEISAPGGQVVLAAGSSVELVDSGTPNVSVKLNASAGEVVNLGRLMAAGGRIDVHAATVNQNGIVRADSLSAGPGGEIVLQATDRLTLAGTSETSAIGDSGRGGQIQLLGREVGLLDTARVDASGGNGGGQVLVGGGLQGKDPSVPNAQAVYFGPAATILADATLSGDGGRIILWSDMATRAFGSLSVRGGRLGGDGGFIETSGGWLDARPARLDTSAPRGRSGSWLLDPFDITVSDSAPATSGVGPDFTAVSDSATIRWADISTALASGTQVTVSTGAAGNTGTQAGNISINVFSSPSVNAGAGGSLTFIADGSIDISGTLAFGGASMPLTFLAGRSGQGVIQLPSTTITLNNGDITFGGFTTYNRAGGGTFQGATGHDASHPTGIDFSSASIDALGGTITLNGGSKYQGPGSGVNIFDSNLLARNIVVNGNTMDFGTTGAGITTSVATLEARQTMDLRGMGTTQGIAIGLESQLILTNSFAPSSLRLFGVGQQSEGVLLDGSSTPFSLIFDKTGGSVAIDGTTEGSESTAVRIIGPGTSTNVIDVSGGTTLTIGGLATSTDLFNARVSANPLDLNGAPFTLHGSQALTLTNSQIASGGPITVHADSMFFDLGTTITSNFAGPTAIVLQGAGSGPIQAFDNLAGATALQVGAGSRWLVFATDPTGFDAGGLAYDFKRYNALPNDTAIASDAGNGLAFSVPQFATVTGTVQTKTYDGTTAATVTNLAASGVNQDQPVASPSISGAVFGSPNASTNNNVTLNDLSLQFVDVNEKPVYGYTPQYLLRGTINPAPVTIAVTGVDKVYDATTQANPVATVTSGLVGAETLGVNSSAQFPIKDVGTYPVSVDIALANGTNGGLASNYSVAPTVNVSASITPASLTVTGVTANNKIYDATLAATLNGTASVAGLQGDVVTLGGTPLANFATKNAGTGIPVGVSGYTLGGTDAGNYALVQPTGLAADITPATLAVNGLQASSKVYDSLTSAALNGSASIAPLGSDVVTLAGSALGNFADKNVGTGKAVLVSGLSLSGTDAGNYQLATTLASTANITPASLTVTGVTANNKVYDATNTATLAGAAGVAALGNDVLTLGGTPLAQFSSANVGTNIAVGVGGYTLSGTDAGNYILFQPTGLAADITPATLRYVATPLTQSIGLPLPPLTGTVAGFVGGETLQTATTGTLQFTTPAQSTSAPGRYTVLGGGLSAANYSFVQDVANNTALTLTLDLSPETIVASKGVDAAPKLALQLMARPTQPADPSLGGVVDLVPGASPTAPDTRTAGATAAPSFEPVTLSDLSSQALADMLDARAQYKGMLFADAVTALEKNPALADMPPCRSRDELRSGACLLTEALKRQMKSTPASAALTPVTPSPAAPTAAPSATPAVPAAAAPVIAAATPSAPLLAGGARRVRNASLPQINRKVALVIGVDQYDDPTIPKLANAVGDAHAIGKVLESQMGYETVVLENATKKALVIALNQLAVELGPRDSVVLFYAGHGELVESTKLGYWQLADSDPKRPETWMSNTDIARMVAHIEASQVALISDSCYSGSLVTDQRIRAAVGTVDPAELLARKSVVVMSSGGNEPVADAGKQGHSPFAWSLMNNLRQLSSWQPGGNVFERVRFAVAKELPQRPQYSAFSAAGDQGGGDYLFEQRQLEPGPQ